MGKEIAKIDPTRTIDLPGYGLDKKKMTIPYAKSEIFLTDLMDNICEKFDSHGRAWYKDTNQLTILSFMDEDGKMHPDMSEVEFVQDGDLNASLPHFVSINRK